MKKLTSLLFFLIFSVYFGHSQDNGSLQNELSKGRAMWIWNNANTVNNVVNDESYARDQLYDFCRSPHGNLDHEIKVLFFGCKDALFHNKQNLRNFLADAHDNELTVEYLDGDPSWATYNQSVGLERIRRVIEFNAAASSAGEKIKGIQFDVEPYLLTASRGYKPPYWDTDRDSVWSCYVAYMDSCQRLIDSTHTDLYFGIAIPRWYENHVGKDELFRLQSFVDYTAIMDYNENSSVIIRDAENEMNNASALNKRVWIGVETKEVSPETVSFHEEGVLYMEAELLNVLNAYGDNPVFSGLAIHSYQYYKSLPLTTAIENQQGVIQKIFLFQNSENPVGSRTKIKFQLPAPMAVEISIFNVLGQKVTTLVNGVKSQGVHEVSWNISGYSPGVYFYQMRTRDNVYARKMILVQ